MPKRPKGQQWGSGVRIGAGVPDGMRVEPGPWFFDSGAHATIRMLRRFYHHVDRRSPKQAGNWENGETSCKSVLLFDPCISPCHKVHAGS
ncbi:hypothetical protein PCAR4_810006 [Paraburkholderia caribensis]|nr:hypothetical protein PCAR4_810006 [Paraburkholderia caribensis]